MSWHKHKWSRWGDVGKDPREFKSYEPGGLMLSSFARWVYTQTRVCLRCNKRETRSV